MEFGKSALFGILLLHCLFLEGKAAKLIVVLVDGLRWDYIDDPNLKAFHHMITVGVKARYVVPVFPSLSYPNYQSLVTGLYPENHGFVSNFLYDNASDSLFNMIPQPGAANARWWNDAEPLWITAEKQGRRSALYWWAGCEVEVRGQHPTICERQMDFAPPTAEAREDFFERVDDLVEMFKPTQLFPHGRMSLALMYYGSVDYAGHNSGPKSSELQSALRDIDDILLKMQEKIKKAGLESKVNTIVVSDHGMTDITQFQKIVLKKFETKIKHQLDYGAISMIVPQPGMLDKLFQELTDEKIEGLLIYKKEDIPEKYHIKGSGKTPPLVLIAKPGYLIEKIGVPNTYKGSHGYDTEEMGDMRSVFLAEGPDFRRRHVPAEPLQMVDIYNVMCNVLKIQPLPNNGSWERVQSMFTKLPAHLPVDNSSIHSCYLSHILLLTTFIAVLRLIHSRFV